MWLQKVVTGLVCLSLASLAYADDAKEVQALTKALDDLWVTDGGTYAEMDMYIKTKNFERNLSLNFWGSGRTKSLVRITKPAKEKGVSTLKVDKDVYNYLPKVARTVKLAEAMMGQSWMGSHFTNSDLVQDFNLNRDFNSTVIAKKKEGSSDIWTLKALAKPDAPTIWRSIVIIADKTKKYPINQDFFDKDGKLIRSISYAEAKMNGDRMIPTKLKATPQTAELKGEFTEITYRKLNRKAKVDSSTFLLTNLQGD